MTLKDLSSFNQICSIFKQLNNENFENTFSTIQDSIFLEEDLFPIFVWVLFDMIRCYPKLRELYVSLMQKIILSHINLKIILQNEISWFTIKSYSQLLFIQELSESNILNENIQNGSYLSSQIQKIKRKPSVQTEHIKMIQNDDLEFISKNESILKNECITNESPLDVSMTYFDYAIICDSKQCINYGLENIQRLNLSINFDAVIPYLSCNTFKTLLPHIKSNHDLPYFLVKYHRNNFLQELNFQITEPIILAAMQFSNIEFLSDNISGDEYKSMSLTLNLTEPNVLQFSLIPFFIQFPFHLYFKFNSSIFHPGCPHLSTIFDIILDHLTSDFSSSSNYYFEAITELLDSSTIVESLHRHGFPGINDINKDRFTPLTKAAALDKSETCISLINCGADIYFDKNLLVYVVSNNMIKLFKLLISRYDHSRINFAEIRSTSYMNLISIAAQGNFREIFQELVQIKDFNNPTSLAEAFYYFILFSNYEYASELLKNPLFDSNAKLSNGQSILSMISSNKIIDHNRVIKILKSKNLSYDPEAFNNAISIKSLSLLQLLMELPDYDVNKVSKKDNNSPLIFSVKNKNLDVVQILIQDDNIDLTVTDYEGNTALMIAIKTGQIDLFQIFLVLTEHESTKIANAAKIWVNMGDNLGNTPLINAILLKDMAMIKMLLNNEYVDVNRQNAAMESPLFVAISTQDLKIIYELMNDPRVDSELRNQFGETPLQKAIELELPIITQLKKMRKKKHNNI